MYYVLANIELLLMNVLLVSLLFVFNLRYWKGHLVNSLSIIYALVFFGSLMEIVAFWADKKPEYIWLNYLSNILYLTTIAVLGLMMLIYCSAQFPQPIWNTKTQRNLLILPAIFEILCLISSPWTGLIISVDEAGAYHRTATFFIQLIPYGYLLLTTAFGIYWYFRAETRTKRNEYLSIAFFAVPPFLLGGTQLLFEANTLDILEFSLSLSLLTNYAISQNNRITRDVLTQLPSREMIESVLSDRLSRQKRGSHSSKLYVLMCDLDGFKTINDTLGHTVGDSALVRAANVLNEVCEQYKAIAGRIGGDEFVIIVETEWEELPDRLIKDINSTLNDASENEKIRLQMSIGYALSRPTDTVTDILKAADKELYRVKADRKALRDFLSEN